MTRYYEKNSKELTLLDKLRLLNGGFHQVNLQLGNPASIAFEQQQQREQYKQQLREQYKQQQLREQYEKQQQIQQIREQYEQRRRNRRNRW